VNQPLPPSSSPSPAQALPAQPLPVPVMPSPSASASFGVRWLTVGAILLGVVTVGSLVLALSVQQRVRSLERELVKRQQESQTEAAEARVVARQAQDVSRDAAAKVAVLDARVSEASLQRSQIEDLIQSLSRSRDENIVSDVESALRVALQQSAITGSAEPLVAALRQSDERLARYNQPRLERVRRAIARDLDRVKAVGVVDISALTIKLDEAVRLVDELPLLSVAAEAHKGRAGSQAAAQQAAKAASGAASAPQPTRGRDNDAWLRWLADGWHTVSQQVWDETRALVRVTRIDTPEAMLVAPEQAYFLRENLKLRLLNARLALLSRQFETAQTDLRDVQGALDRYFDRGAKRVGNASELVRQVASQARLVSVPRPDETLAALTAAAAGR
jgi:uroporphyrin-3 C-methyltransferase